MVIAYACDLSSVEARVSCGHVLRAPAWRAIPTGHPALLDVDPCTSLPVGANVRMAAEESVVSVALAADLFADVLGPSHCVREFVTLTRDGWGIVRAASEPAGVMRERVREEAEQALVAAARTGLLNGSPLPAPLQLSCGRLEMRWNRGAAWTFYPDVKQYPYERAFRMHTPPVDAAQFARVGALVERHGTPVLTLLEPLLGTMPFEDALATVVDALR